MAWNAQPATERFTMIPHTDGLIETAPIPLSNTDSRQQSTMGGWGSIVFGLIFGGAGAGLIAVGLGFIAIQNASKGFPLGILTLVGALFATCGLLMIVGGVRSFLASAAVRRRWEQHPWQPWMADYAWNPEGVSSTGLTSAFRDLFIFVLMAAFLTPFNWVSFFSDAGFIRYIFGAVTLLFDLFTLLMLGRGLYRLLQGVKFGKTFVKFDRFPFFLGETLDVRVVVPSKVALAKTIDLELRCVEERIERDDESTKIVCCQIYSETRSVPATLAPGPDGAVLAVSFKLPKGECGTRLSLRPPRYWELLIKADMPGIDYATKLLVPVYDRPGL